MINLTLKLSLGLLAAALSLSSFAVDNKLIGDWRSANAVKGALKGAIVLEKDGKAKVLAESQPELVGTWAVPEKGKLHLTMGDSGTAVMRYSFLKSQLVLTYDNGNQQKFIKEKAKK